jgi:hypothetical protein
MKFRGTIQSSAACLIALAGIAGCSGAGNSAAGSGGTGGSGSEIPAQLIYVTQSTTSGYVIDTILAFAAGANGSVAPEATIALPAGMYVQCVATDSSGNIYVSGFLASAAAVVEIYSPGASGAPTPVRTITTPFANAPTAMAIDSSGELYTLNGTEQLSVYSSTASGNAVPIRSISGMQTDMVFPLALAIDTADNIYVSQYQNSPTQGGILFFAAGASGNVAPTRAINFPVGDSIESVAVDGKGNVYATDDPPSSGSSILEFTSGSSGQAAPAKTISGSATGLYEVYGLGVDGAGNLFVENKSAPSSSGSTLYIDEFAPTASGNVAPAASMSSTSWLSGEPQIALK